MGMGMGMGMAGVPPEFSLHPVTLQYTLAPSAPASFPDLIHDPPWADSADEKWDPGLLAVTCLQEFAEATTPGPWTGITFPASVLQWQSSPTFVTGEIHALQVLMQDQRERYLTEIVAQNDNAPEYWVSLLGLDRKTRFWNLVLLHVALRVGEMAVMHFKHKYKRRRPSDLCPGLCPPFGPPAHPAFPSGHATQGWLMTFCLERALPEFVPPPGPYKARQAALRWLADRVAVNRERGGFHYPSDSLAGHHLAQECFKRLDALPASSRFKTLLGFAQGEWNAPGSVLPVP